MRANTNVFRAYTHYKSNRIVSFRTINQQVTNMAYYLFLIEYETDKKLDLDYEKIITDVVNDDCEILPDADEADLAAIESVKVKSIPTKSGEVGVEREVKLSSKLKALELLGKHLGMWNNKLDVNMNVPVIFEGEDNIAN